MSRSATPINPGGYYQLDEEQKEFYRISLKLKFDALLFKNNEFLQKALSNFFNFTVIKYPRIWQSLFYILKIPREEICEDGTNKLKWKSAKKWLKPNTKLWDMMAEYEGSGSKDDQYTDYQMVPFIEKNVESITVEDVNPYNQVVAGRIISWVLNAIRLRKGDITRRKSLFRRSIELREEAIQKEAARKARLEVEIVDAENKYSDEHKEDMEAYLQYQQRS